MSPSPRPDQKRRLARLAIAAAALFAPALFPATAAAQGRSMPSRTLLDRFGLERAWASQATIDVSSDVVRHVVADEDVVIVQTRSGIVTVLDAQNGRKLWDGQLARGDQFSFPAVTNADTLFVVLGSTIYARDKFSGNDLWALQLPSVPSTSPAVDERRMYVGMLEGSVYAFDLAKIRKFQLAGTLDRNSAATVLWRYKTSDRILTRPVSNGTYVAFASETGILYNVTATDRKLVFQLRANGTAAAPLVIDREISPTGESASYLYFASSDQNFYCLRMSNGTTRWEYVTGRPVDARPVVLGGQVFLSPVRGGIYSLATKTGIATWWAPTAREFLTASPTKVFVSDEAGNVTLLDRATGGVLGVLPVKDFPVRVQNDRTDRAYIASATGLVVCLREQGAEIPIYHRFPERRPILPEVFDENAPPEAPADAAPADPAAEPAVGDAPVE